MFYLSGVGLALFLDLLLLSKRNKSEADKILASWLIAVALHLLLFALLRMKVYTFLLGVDIPLPLLHGPFLYLYTLTLTNRKPYVGWLHFAPFALMMVYMLIIFFPLPMEQKIFVYEHKGAGFETFNAIRVPANFASGIIYLTLSMVALRRHRKNIANQFSNTDRINLQWLQYMIYWLGAIWLFVIFSLDDFVFGSAVLFIVFIGYFGIRQVGIFHSPEPAAPSRVESGVETADRPKYQKSGLNADNSEALHQRLAAMMTGEKLYRNTELSLTELARRLDIPPNYLSQVINEREGKSFYDYVNTLRIEEFKRLATSPDSRKYTLLALAQECGFNSKSSFNRYFKKVTGKSPSEFVQVLQD